MHSSSQCLCDDAATRCAICGRKFGLVRHYAWQTALCSNKCCEQFRAREKGDREWLSAGEHRNGIPIRTLACIRGSVSEHL
jgi:hypothetical protein